MIVTPEGLNVFPEDVERVLERVAGRARSAVVGVADGAEERVHAVLVLEPAPIRTRSSAAPTPAAGPPADPRRVGLAGRRTAAHRRHAQAEARARFANGCDRARSRRRAATGDTVEALIARFARGRGVSGATTLEELGLSSLERVELMVALEDRFQTRHRRRRASRKRRASRDLKQLVEAPPTADEVGRAGGLPDVEPHRWPVR